MVEASGESAVPLPAPPSYALTRFMVLRLLGVVYLVAFWCLIRQGLPLIGHHGLLPADQFIRDSVGEVGSRWDAFLRMPSLFWAGVTDRELLLVGWVGLITAAFVVAGYANALMMLFLWALYLSVVHVGQLFYGYGWEIQLCETGFLAIFLCPLLSMKPFPERAAPRQVIWLFWWLIFRIMLGAGLIKMRGDPCWRNLTCLDYHFETQPIPNPLSPGFDLLPHAVHAFGVLFNHYVELGCPLLLFAGRRARHLAAFFMAALQLTLILSGNLSFLNWLTLVPILACFDDGLWARVLPRSLVERAKRSAALPPLRVHNGLAWALVAVIAVLSIKPVGNLLSAHQMMNTGFEPLELVNSYGAFGSVGKVRDEIIVEGTSDPVPDASAHWLRYEFLCKPGDPMRRPCIVSPYQPRLDWQMWFAAMSSVDEEPWFVHLVWKLLHNDPGVLSLMASNPFAAAPPRFIRASLYRYEFAKPGEPGWWKRRYLGVWMPPLSADDSRLREALQAYGWLPERSE